MAFVHGKATVFQVTDSGATNRDLSAYLTNVSFPRDFDTAETSTFGNTYKTYIVGLGSSTIQIQGRYDSTATSGPDVVLSGLIGLTTTSTVKYGPEGLTTGKVQYNGLFFLSQYQITGSISSDVTFTAQFVLGSNAGITKTTWP